MSLRDNLLITAGTRLGYMHAASTIDVPSGIVSEDEVAEFITDIVDEYIEDNIDRSFDLYIEERIMVRYGV